MYLEANLDVFLSSRFINVCVCMCVHISESLLLCTLEIQMKVEKRKVRSGNQDSFILLPSSALMHCVTLGKSFNLSCSSIRQKDDAYLLHENELIAVCQLLSSLWMNQIDSIYVSVYNFACIFLFGACLCLGAQILQVNAGYLLGREPLLYISDVMQIRAMRNT